MLNSKGHRFFEARIPPSFLNGERSAMLLISFLATLLLGLLVMLCVGTFITHARMMTAKPSWVEEIRHLRQEGLAVHQDGDA